MKHFRWNEWIRSDTTPNKGDWYSDKSESSPPKMAKNQPAADVYGPLLVQQAA